MYTGQYECVELFVKPAGNAKGSVILKDSKGTIVEQRELAHVYGNWIRIPVAKETEYEIQTENGTVTYAYLSETENLLEKGICVLDTENGFKEMSKEAFRRQMDTPCREKYHFTPVVNWNNDPNGLCWFQGYYHMFYQLNPFGQEWNNMYWGHAASKDLIHWIHLPVVLAPQEEILDDTTIKGGAFSGSALVKEQEVLFYLTRHIGPQEDGDATVQYQTMTRSSDMIHFQQEKEIIREKPEGTNYDFRDPKVVKFGDRYYIVLGACVNGKGTILLYESEDGESWSYKCPLLVEETPMRTIECPDFFFLDGQYVAMGAWMSHYDEYGRYQQCRYYTGDWQGEGLAIKSQQWVDFGSQCYAAQTFEHEGRRLFFGWISDFYGEHIPEKQGAYGSMTLPRELHVQEGHVYARPAKEVYQLKQQLLYKGEAKEIAVNHIPGNCYYARLDFGQPGDFSVSLGGNQEKSISFHGEEGKVFLKTKGVKSEEVSFISSVSRCISAEIFVDGRTVEVYLNDGEDVGTKLFYHTGEEGSFHLVSSSAAKAELYTMASIW